MRFTALAATTTGRVMNSAFPIFGAGPRM